MILPPNIEIAITDKLIFITGGDFEQTYIHYIASLTKKSNPKICFVPTAAADDDSLIDIWLSTCSNLGIQPFVLRTFISSFQEHLPFRELLLSMDAIIVSGGNTLNMLAIWKAHGIDQILKEAYDLGIILAGGSAGSLCWFDQGFTDSRPNALSVVQGLGFLRFSHCPHYNSEPTRKYAYLQSILNGQFDAGFACDSPAGLLFINGKVQQSLTLSDGANNYFISLLNGKVNEEIIPTVMIST